MFEIGDEGLRQPTAVKFIPPAGLDLGERWRVRFQATGPLGGQVGDRSLATNLRTEAQYPISRP